MEQETLTNAEAASIQKLSTSTNINIESKACVTVVDKPRTIIMHRIQESELRDLGAAQVTLNTNLAFFTLTVGLFAGFATVLLTTHQVLSDRMLMAFCGLTLVSLVSGAFFGINAWRDRGKVRQNIERLINDSRESAE
jgi:hypothetical protein